MRKIIFILFFIPVFAVAQKSTAPVRPVQIGGAMGSGYVLKSDGLGLGVWVLDDRITTQTFEDSLAALRARIYAPDGNNYTINHEWNAATGNLTIQRAGGLESIITNIDGRYALISALADSMAMARGWILTPTALNIEQLDDSTIRFVYGTDTTDIAFTELGSGVAAGGIEGSLQYKSGSSLSGNSGLLFRDGHLINGTDNTIDAGFDAFINGGNNRNGWSGALISGYHNNNQADVSLTAGYKLVNYGGIGSAAVGRWNDSLAALTAFTAQLGGQAGAGRLFTVGNGNSEGTRSDAFWVNGRGQIGMPLYKNNVAGDSVLTTDEEGIVKMIHKNEIGSNYTLPIATAEVLGGIRIGSGLNIDPGTGVVNATFVPAGPDGSVMFKSGDTLTGSSSFLYYLNNTHNNGLLINSLYLGQQPGVNNGTSENSFIIGSGNNLTDGYGLTKNNLVVGENNYGSVLFGTQSNNLIIGENNVFSGANSTIVVGRSNWANGFYSGSAVFGSNNNASTNNSLVSGNDNTQYLQAGSSIVSGSNLHVSSRQSGAWFGQFNDSAAARNSYNTIPTSRILTVGNGTSYTNRSDALALNVRGELWLPRYKNNLAGDSVLTTDTDGKIVMVHKSTIGGGGGGGVAWGSITGTLSSQTDLQSALNAKQATLVSGTNIKTINGTSILGSGNITISGGGDYTLPTASASVLGGVKVGNTLEIDGSGVLNTKVGLSGRKIYHSSASVDSYDVGDGYDATYIFGNNLVDYDQTFTLPTTSRVDGMKITLINRTTDRVITTSTSFWLDNTESTTQIDAGEKATLIWNENDNKWYGYKL